MNPLEWGPWLYGKFFANHHPVWGYLFACSVALLIALVAWTQIKDKYEAEHPPQTTRPLSQEHLTLKQLFLTDFKVFANNTETTLTIGSKSHKFSEVTLKFTAQLWMDLREGTEILGFYIPIQDKDPEESSKRTVRLCRILPDNFPQILKQLRGMEVSVSNDRGNVEIYRLDAFPPSLYLSRRLHVSARHWRFSTGIRDETVLVGIQGQRISS